MGPWPFPLFFNAGRDGDSSRGGIQEKGARADHLQPPQQGVAVASCSIASGSQCQSCKTDRSATRHVTLCTCHRSYFQAQFSLNNASAIPHAVTRSRPPETFLQFCSRGCLYDPQTKPVHHVQAGPTCFICTGLSAETEESPRTNTTQSLPRSGGGRRARTHQTCLPGTAREFPATPVFPNAPNNRPRVRVYTFNAGASEELPDASHRRVGSERCIRRPG